MKMLGFVPRHNRDLFVFLRLLRSLLFVAWIRLMYWAPAERPVYSIYSNTYFSLDLIAHFRSLLRSFLCIWILFLQTDRPWWGYMVILFVFPGFFQKTKLIRFFYLLSQQIRFDHRGFACETWFLPTLCSQPEFGNKQKPNENYQWNLRNCWVSLHSTHTTLFVNK